jgi:hypothetical protein
VIGVVLFGVFGERGAVVVEAGAPGRENARTYSAMSSSGSGT